MIKIKRLDKIAIGSLHYSFSKVGWEKPVSLFEKYLEEQNSGAREVLVALFEGDVAGYGTLVWESKYDFFKKRDIPEINDLNVLPNFRGKGIATLILNDFEKRVAKTTHSKVGIGFGLYKDYGAAQSLYIKRGYLPNKEGVTYNYQNVVPGRSYPIDDDLVLWFVKNLK
jgi:GNAT superfamily N-acetyltransferase